MTERGFQQSLIFQFRFVRFGVERRLLAFGSGSEFRLSSSEFRGIPPAGSTLEIFRVVGNFRAEFRPTGPDPGGYDP
jgi:hypothetical protein